MSSIPALIAESAARRLQHHGAALAMAPVQKDHRMQHAHAWLCQSCPHKNGVEYWNRHHRKDCHDCSRAKPKSPRYYGEGSVGNNLNGMMTDGKGKREVKAAAKHVARDRKEPAVKVASS